MERWEPTGDAACEFRMSRAAVGQWMTLDVCGRLPTCDALLTPVYVARPRRLGRACDVHLWQHYLISSHVARTVSGRKACPLPPHPSRTGKLRTSLHSGIYTCFVCARLSTALFLVAVSQSRAARALPLVISAKWRWTSLGCHTCAANSLPHVVREVPHTPGYKRFQAHLACFSSLYLLPPAQIDLALCTPR